MLYPPLAPARILVLVFFCFVCSGCGSSDGRKPVFPVRGSVLVAGKPAVKALVVFHPLNEPEAPRPSGEVGTDGTFTLSTHTTGDGAPAGEYAVTVLWLSGSSTIGGDADSGPDRLGNRYSDPKSTTLRARVNEAPTELKPFSIQ
jgi:hypothetical protein